MKAALIVITRALFGTLLGCVAAQGLTGGLSSPRLFLLSVLPLSLLVFSALVVAPTSPISFERLAQIFFSSKESELRKKALARLAWLYYGLAFVAFFGVLTAVAFLFPDAGVRAANSIVACSLLFGMCGGLLFAASSVLKLIDWIRGKRR